MNLLAELRRRDVLRAGVLYAGAVWASAQGISQLGPAVGLPDGATRWFLIATAIGFPFWLAFAWFYELTPQGLKRESAIAADPSVARPTGRRLDRAIILVLAIAVVLLLTNTFAWKNAAGPPQSAGPRANVPAKSIAVLPFENLSAEKDNEYFVAGMQDLILTKLSDIGELKVISRTSTAKYRSRPENLKVVGEELGVANVLEGSVQRRGNAVLVTVQLIDAATDAHVWAETYQRTLDNVFGVEGEVAGRVADALKARLSPASAGRLATSLSSNPEADDLYLRAEYSSHRGDTDFTTAPYKQAIASYRAAIDKFPDFALALARLSYTESALAWLGGGGEDVAQLVVDAQASAERALKLAPQLPDARLAMGYSHYYGSGEYVAALADFVAALQLRPNDARALTAQGYVLRRQGNFDAGIDSLLQARALDPRNSELALALGETLMMAARHADAEATLQRALALDPTNLQARFRHSWGILISRGDVAAALAAAHGDEPRLQLLRVYLLTLQRDDRAALELLDAVPDTPDNFYQSSGGPKVMQQAGLYQSLGDTTRARNLYTQSLPLLRDFEAAAAGIPIKAVPVWILSSRLQVGLGHHDEALAALAKAQDLLGQVEDYADGPYMIELIAAAYANAGRADLAIPLLEKAFATPGIGLNYSPPMLWIDPAWDPVRDDPRFQAVLRKYADRKPALVPQAAGARGTANG